MKLILALFLRTSAASAPLLPRIELETNCLSSTPQMHLQDVLQRVCSKMKFKASDYVLAISGSVEPLEMNLTVASLEAKHELVLVKRSSAVTRKSLVDQL